MSGRWFPNKGILKIPKILVEKSSQCKLVVVPGEEQACLPFSSPILGGSELVREEKDELFLGACHGLMLLSILQHERNLPTTSRPFPPFKHSYDIKTFFLNKRINGNSSCRPESNDRYSFPRRTCHFDTLLDPLRRDLSLRPRRLAMHCNK